MVGIALFAHSLDQEFAVQIGEALWRRTGLAIGHRRFNMLRDLDVEDVDRAILVRTEFSHPLLIYEEWEEVARRLWLATNGRLTVVHNWPNAQTLAPAANVIDLTGWRGDPADSRIGNLAFLLGAPRTEEHELPQASEAMTPSRALSFKVDDIGFSTRTSRALASDDVVYVGDLVQRTEADILRMPNLGRKSLNEIKSALRALGLRLGLDPSDWSSAGLDSADRLTDAARKAVAIRQAPLGAIFQAEEEFLVIDPSGDDSDEKAAGRPIIDQLRREGLEKARAFGALAQRLDNQLGWQGIGATSARLVSLLDRPTPDIPDVLGHLYSVSLTLGSYRGLDVSLLQGEQSNAMPLDAEVRRSLDDTLQTLAPWLRSFPTIREWDDQLGQYQGEEVSADASRKVVTSAGEARLVLDDDLAEVQGLLNAPQGGDVQGAKAGRRGILSTRNMVIATAGLFGSLILADYGAKSVLVGKAGTFLASAETAIIELIADLPHDIRLAIEIIVAQNRELPLLPPREPHPIRTQAVRAPGKPGTEEGDGIPGGELFNMDGGWYVRHDGGNGAFVPLMLASFATDYLDPGRTYRVHGYLLDAGGYPHESGTKPAGFSALEVIMSSTGNA